MTHSTIKQITVVRHRIESTGARTFTIHEPSGFFTNPGLFYYDRANTEMYHRYNLEAKRVNSPFYHQLIGMDQPITNKRVYTRLINAYIKGEL